MQIKSEHEDRGLHSGSLLHLSSRLAARKVLRAGRRHGETAMIMAVLGSLRGFPNLPQWAIGAVDRVVIGNWQGSDSVIGLWPFAG
jgi:hypothetical protein